MMPWIILRGAGRSSLFLVQSTIVHEDVFYSNGKGGGGGCFDGRLNWFYFQTLN